MRHVKFLVFVITILSLPLAGMPGRHARAVRVAARQRREPVRLGSKSRVSGP